MRYRFFHLHSLLSCKRRNASQIPGLQCSPHSMPVGYLTLSAFSLAILITWTLSIFLKLQPFCTGSSTSRHSPCQSSKQTGYSRDLRSTFFILIPTYSLFAYTSALVITLPNTYLYSHISHCTNIVRALSACLSGLRLPLGDTLFDASEGVWWLCRRTTECSRLPSLAPPCGLGWLLMKSTQSMLEPFLV
jgi:hypothetical protein